MGNKESKSYRPPTFKKQNWRETNKTNLKPQHGVYRLLLNNITNEQIQQYAISFHNLAEFQKYLQFFQWRQREDNIVNTKYMNYEQNRQFCNTNYAAKIYIEHIPVRLSDIQDIPYPQNLYLLFGCLDGFQKLYTTVGYFRISEDLICMDKDGKVKVWLNADLSKCHSHCTNFSDQQNDFRRTENLQQRMVDQIIRIIEENTTEDIEADMTVTDFIRHNHKGKGLNFKSAKQEIIAYAETYNADIPNFFESVIGIFDDPPSQNQEPPKRQITQHPYRQQNHENHLIQHYQKIPNHIRNEDSYQEQFDRGNNENSTKVAGVHSHYRVLQRGPSQSNLESEKRNFSSVPAYNLQNSFAVASNPFRTQSPISSLPPLQIGTINRSKIRVFFNYPSATSLYRPQTISTIVQSTSQPNVTAKSYKISYESNLDKQETKLDASFSQKCLTQPKKIEYSDTTDTYQLDPQIAEDMQKYLNL